MRDDGEEVRALLDVRPYATRRTSHLWVASDLTPGLDGAPIRVDRTTCSASAPAATSLAQLTIRDPRPVLDLGTGCGVQALHLAAHADQVVATDVNASAAARGRLQRGPQRATEHRGRATGSLFDPVRASVST